MDFTGTVPLPCTKFVGGRLVVSFALDLANISLIRVLRYRGNCESEPMKGSGCDEFHFIRADFSNQNRL